MKETRSGGLTQSKSFSLIYQYMDGISAMDCANFLEFFPFSKIVQGGLTLLLVPMDNRLGFDSGDGFAWQSQEPTV